MAGIRLLELGFRQPRSTLAESLGGIPEFNKPPVVSVWQATGQSSSSGNGASGQPASGKGVRDYCFLHDGTGLSGMERGFSWVEYFLP